MQMKSYMSKTKRKFSSVKNPSQKKELTNSCIYEVLNILKLMLDN